MASADMATRREEARRRQSGGARSGARSAASAGGSRGGLGEPTPVNSTTTSEDTRGRAASWADSSSHTWQGKSRGAGRLSKAAEGGGGGPLPGEIQRRGVRWGVQRRAAAASLKEVWQGYYP